MRITTKNFPLIAFILLTFALLFSSSVYPEEKSDAVLKQYALFTPPPEWEIVDAHSLSPRVVIGFMHKASTGICPSINLAIEEINVSQNEYVQAVKKLYDQDRTSRWRDLGKITTQAGQARLTEIDTQSKLGPVRMLQMIIIKDHKAYIMTAAASKKELSSYYPAIKACFSSFRLEEDLLSLLGSPEKKNALSEKISQMQRHAQSSADPTSWIKEWDAFKDSIIKDYTQQGLLWQWNVLLMVHESLSTDTASSKDA